MTRLLLSVCVLAVVTARAACQPVSAEVTFKGAGDLELHGTLLLPERTLGAAPAGVGAVLLLPGSGPTDRNGNQPPGFVTNLLSQIADRLAAEGIATLRFDKRAAHVYAAQWPKGADQIGEFFSYDNFVGDATAAYLFLRGGEGVDAVRVAILGHSEGGLFALQIGSDLAATGDRPAGLILAGTPGRTLDEVVREQIRALLEKQTTDQSVRDTYMAHLERGIAAAKNRAPVPRDMPPGLAPLFNPSAQKLLYSCFTIDPAGLAARVRGPVLVLQGERDSQVSAERDAPRLVEALKKRETAEGNSTELVLVPGASHNLKSVQNAGDAGIAGPAAPQALDAIAEWCKAHLGP
ncbi:MAG: alpha/beta fold hydrolase [Phycisphaerales bacterium]|nr:alpha/beta fold hydrolase [Phycisphaerales bacterium]